MTSVGQRDRVARRSRYRIGSSYLGSINRAFIPAATAAIRPSSPYSLGYSRRLLDELIASISLLLSLFNKQFEYSLSF